MKELATIRRERGFSQRRLAARANVSFRTVQMLESGQTDPRLSTLNRISVALGNGSSVLESEIDHLLKDSSDSVHAVSRMICTEGEDRWRLWLFEFVDAFRRQPSSRLIECPPVPGTSEKIAGLLAATVEALCDETDTAVPWWCMGVAPLPDPWFVCGLESLKASALMESPVYFRQRNIFVLANFLERA